jgi:hypothetical protein
VIEFIDSIEPVFFILAGVYIIYFSFEKKIDRIEAKLDNVHRRMDGKKIRLPPIKRLTDIFEVKIAMYLIAFAASDFVVQKIPFLRGYDWSKSMADYGREEYAAFGVCFFLTLIGFLFLAFGYEYLTFRRATRNLVLNMSESQVRKVMGEPNLTDNGWGDIWVYDRRNPPIELSFTDGRLDGWRPPTLWSELIREKDEDGEQE